MAVARLKVQVTDVNDREPQFQGLDVNGVYPAAVSDYTRKGDAVIYVSAIDMDSTAPNNEVGELLQVTVVPIANELSAVSCNWTVTQ